MYFGPASWSSGQGLWLLIMRSRVRFPVLPWEFFLVGKIPVVTMVWVVSRFRLKAPPGISSSCISPLTSSEQRSRASRASQPQKSATLSPQPGGKPRSSSKHVVALEGGEKKNSFSDWALDGGWGGWSTTRPCRFALGNVPRAGLDGCGKSRALREWIPLPSRPHTIAVPANFCLYCHGSQQGTHKATSTGTRVCRSPCMYHQRYNKSD